jgi:hypothetical protein
LEGLFVFVLPPFGWSTGFIATPLTLGLKPTFLKKPALPKIENFFSILALRPKKTKELSGTIFLSPEGSQTSTTLKSLKYLLILQ